MVVTQETVLALRTAGIPVKHLIENPSETITDLAYEWDGVEGTVTINGQEWCTRTTDGIFILYYEEYALDENGVEDLEEVDSFGIAYFQL